MRLHDVYVIPAREKFIRDCVDSGRFDSITEVVNEALGLLELHAENEEVRNCVLQAELKKGLDALEAGHFISFETAGEMRTYAAEMRRQYREQFAAGEMGS